MNTTKSVILQKLAMAGYSLGVILLILGVMLSLFAHPVSAQTGTSQDAQPSQVSNDSGAATQSSGDPKDDATKAAPTQGDDHAQVTATSDHSDDQGGQDATKIAPTESKDQPNATATPKAKEGGDHDGDDQCDGDHDADDVNCGADQAPTHTPRPTHTPQATHTPRATHTPTVKATATSLPTTAPADPTQSALDPTSQPTSLPTAQPTEANQLPTAAAVSPTSPAPTQPSGGGSSSGGSTATPPATLAAPSAAQGTQALLPVTGADLSGPSGPDGNYSTWMIQIGAVILGMAFILQAFSRRTAKTQLS